MNKRSQHQLQNVNETSTEGHIATQVYYNPPAVVDELVTSNHIVT